MRKNTASRAEAGQSRTTFYVLLSLLGLLLVVCVVLYSIYLQQAGTALSGGLDEDEPTELAAGSPPYDPDAVAVDPEETGESGESGGGLPLEGEDPLQELDVPGAQEPLAQEKEPEPEKEPAATLPATYTVRKGDTLRSISMRFYDSNQYASLIAEANQIVFINDMRVGDRLTIPALGDAATAERPTGNNGGDYSGVKLPATYLVQAGDTLYSISRKFYDSTDYVKLLAEHNGLDADSGLKAGTNLTIPKPKGGSPAKDNGKGNGKGNDKGGSKGESSSTETVNKKHTVGKGETLYSLSRKYYGDNSGAKRIADANGLPESYQVKVGEVLQIP
ncbi:hypothetical protein PA598K_07098 [Paenibacillus sp. 598K]|uniref:LysM peptidoglycan-binding domain-containing protein n=1 Tax=Paenibacillus sp. 598K TaxID=1117987 RepID=UPI000FF9A212|nr:LysM peptidoglycan-binding domain-containing protein [Paenibacillus sp. 598K]GBF78453.1 hypothetical protein PA598K_07098 [Paenibacillus sp. 598K]